MEKYREPEGTYGGLLRTAALAAAVAGAAVSTALTAYAGRRNSSRMLVFMFIAWVLSPFAAMIAGWAMSKGWSAFSRTALYCAMVVIPLLALPMYWAVALEHARVKTGFAFLMIPAGSWLLIAIAAGIAQFIQRRGDGTHRAI